MTEAMHARRTMSLLEVDPDLGALVPPERREAARTELRVEILHMPEGPWNASPGANPWHVGLLLLDGVIAREVVVSDTVSTELLGPGDVLRPWSIIDAPSLLQQTIRWRALTEGRVAVLDRRFALRLAQWPEVNAALIDRVNARAQRLATTQAISQLNRVDRRLLSLFWHLAERWGRMTADGVAIPLTLSHRMLGQLVGARRPTVSTAIADLAERKEVLRREDGTWVLTGRPVGIPTAEAERVIPIRRKLIGKLRDDEPQEGTEVVVGEEPEVPAFRITSEELCAAVTRLCEESRSRIDHFHALSGIAQEIKAATAARREAWYAERQRS